MGYKFKKPREEVDTLINFSGGSESTYYLWKYLTDNPTKELLVHNIHLPETDRYKNEQEAVYNILNWCRENGLNNFHLISSEFKYGDLRPIFDVDLVGFMTGIIVSDMKGYPNLKNVLMSYSFEETPLVRKKLKENDGVIPENWDQRTGRAIKMTKTIGKRPVNFLFSHIKKTKPEMVQEMPEELKELIWYCRRPLNGVNRCETCPSCKSMNKSINNSKITLN